MAADDAPEAAILDLESRLSRESDGHHAFTLTPAWWQQRLLNWATTDPEFRIKLLRFVDVLPTLRSARAVADHVRQYFRDPAPPLVHTASGLAAQPVFRPVLSQVVRQGVFAMAHRFIAGSTPKEAIPPLRSLAREGSGFTVDLLGEETLSDAEADAYAARYADLLQTLAASVDAVAPHGKEWEGVPPVNISVKLSALCAHFEPAAPAHVSEVTRARLRPFLRLAREHNAFVNFDMEQYRYRRLAHQVFADLVTETEFADMTRVGIVVQAYLRDAGEDLARLLALARRRGAPLTIRLVKGAYWDEERIVAAQNGWPVPVWEEKADTDASFERCTDALLSAWPDLRPAIGSHNPHSVAQAAVKARRHGIPDEAIEFQVLYGMAEDLRHAIGAEGYRTRVYVPIGQVIPGMAYLVRRLLENTSNQAWFNVGVSAAPADAPLVLRQAQDERGRQAQDERGAEGERATPVGARRASPLHGHPPAAEAFRNAPPAQFFLPVVREEMLAALAKVRRGFGARHPLLIGGREVVDRPQAAVRYPADPDVVIGYVAQATPEDAGTAVSRARAAFPAWRDLPATERGRILRRAADLMEQRRFELAAAMVYESAKPWHEADGDVIEAIDYLRYYAAQGERLSRPQTMGGAPGEHNEYFHEGRGVAAIIAPWNFPLAIITGMSVGALAGGNAAILKPAAQSPVIAHRVVCILREAGVPPDVVQYLPGRGSEVGRALVEHPGVDIIAFTGSNAVGMGMVEAAGRVQPGQRGVKRVIAELGGKNAVIIDDDADLDQAVHGAAVSAFGYAGQKCSACSRLIIVGSAYESALERLRNAVASLVVGPPDDPATFVPPVIGADARERITGYIEAGKRRAEMVAQGPVPDSPGYYVPPTVFAGVPLDSPLACEEIFGPVLSIFRARDFGEALEMAMDSAFALTGGVFSRNPRHIEMAKQRFRVGNLYVNRKVTGAIVGRQPFGGLAMSGVGEKAGGPDYVRQFMEPRVVTENTMRRGFAPEG